MRVPMRVHCFFCIYMFLFFKGGDANASSISFRNWVDQVIAACCLPTNRPQYSTTPSVPLTGTVHLISDATLDRVLRGFDIIAWRNDCSNNNVYGGTLVKVVIVHYHAVEIECYSILAYLCVCCSGVKRTTRNVKSHHTFF
jgi:hypothetical protein